jgi:hypothetical protein
LNASLGYTDFARATENLKRRQKFFLKQTMLLSATPTGHEDS